MIQPHLCLPLHGQKRGRWEVDLLVEGNVVVVGVWRQHEAGLRQHWRQNDAAVFGVEPKKCVLGKRSARFSINVLLSV